MPRAKSICLEDLGDAPPRFVQCIVLPGNEPGLGLESSGAISWKADRPGCCELYVSVDDRLILLCTDPTVVVEVSRSGRSLRAPVGKPVVVLHGDQIRVAERRYGLHVHGATHATHAPLPFEPRPGPRGVRIAAAIALGASVASGCAGSDDKPNPVDAGLETAREDAVADQSIEDGPTDAIEVITDAAVVTIDVLDAPPKAIP